jgi:hypothetical protein
VILNWGKHVRTENENKDDSNRKRSRCHCDEPRFEGR